MQRYEWNFGTDPDTAYRRAGGRRRYNAMRRRRAEERRAAMVEALEGMGPAAYFFNCGLAGGLARAFGVHHATAWRDLQILFGPGCNYDFYGPGGDFLFTVTRAYGGGPIWAVTDADGNEIRGPERRRILRSLPRYVRRRYRQRT